MYKLIQLVAPDRTGKSSLARKLSNESGAQVFHFGPPDLKAPTPLTRFEVLLSPTTELTISDRSYLEYSIHDEMLCDLHHDPSDVRCLIHNFENRLSQVYDEVEIWFLEREWDREMLRRHLVEVKSYGYADWYNDLLIEQRKRHHSEFNDKIQRMFAMSRFEVKYI